MIVICLLFFFSGFAALTYELLWFRRLGLIFGNTVQAAAAVTSAFMLGMAIGAHFSGKWAESLKRPIRLFGVMELGIGAYALAMPQLFDVLRVIYRELYHPFADLPILLTLCRLAPALLLLLTPASFMGATLPLLAKRMLPQKEGFGARLGALYGINTFGGVIGILCCGFFLIPNVGLNITNKLTVGISLTVGLLAWLASRRFDVAPATVTPNEESDHEAAIKQREMECSARVLSRGVACRIIHAAGTAALHQFQKFRGGLPAQRSARAALFHVGAAGKETYTGRLRFLLLATGASGFLALAFEVIWFRALILIFGSTTYSFSAMLAVFLLGIALGSLLLSWIGDRLKHPVLLFAVAELGIGIHTVWSMRHFTAKPEFLLRYLVNHGFTWGSMITANFAITMSFLLAPTVLFGMAFTSAARAARESLASSPRAVGEAYTFNTIGAVLGAYVAGFVFLPMLGIENSLRLLSALALFLGLSLLAAAGGQSRRQRADALQRGVNKLTPYNAMRILVAAVSLACALGLFGTHWDKRILAAGAYFSPWNFVRDNEITLHDQINSERLLFYEEGVTATVSTTRTADERLYFSIDGKVEADTSPRGMVVQRMIGHLPMLFHSSPRSVLNIGLGAGVTLGALGCYPLDRLEVVEIEPKVRNVARIWAKHNNAILEHPKLHVIIGDGRNHLFCTTNFYDVITSDPFEPVVGGAANLFTVEHFQQARKRLYAGGIMCQWIPMYELSQESFSTILRSFVHVFPESALFFTGFDVVVLGFNGPLTLNPSLVREKFSMPAVERSFAEIGFTRSDMIPGMFVAEMRKSLGLLMPVPLNTDTHPIIEFQAPRHALRYTSDINQQVLLDNFTDIPDSFLQGFTDEQRAAMIQCHEALRLVLQASILRSAGRAAESFDLLKQAIGLAPENPVIRNELVAALLASAQTMLNSGELGEAFLQYQIVLQYQPDQFWALYHLVNLAMRARRTEVARNFLDRGVAAHPDSPLFRALRGKFRGTLGDQQGACDDLRAAVCELPHRRDLWEDYALSLEHIGDIEGAGRANAEAERLGR